MQSNLKYRPEDFIDIVGNKYIVDSLDSMFESKKVPHTFLFIGSAGCGKTTFARIICKKLKCSDQDLIEINASNTRGIDTARDIIKSSYLKPMDGKVKVYILDEVHKATNEFQNALLKVLEEPPDHTYFILCTTEPAKVINTIHSRSAVYEVSILSSKKMTKLLEMVIVKEKTKLAKEVLNEIVKKAEGVPRDALLILDQVINIKSTKAQISAVRKIKFQEKLVIDLCRALMERKNWKVVSEILRSINGDPEQIRRAVLGYFNKVLQSRADPHAALVIDSFRDNTYDTGMAGITLACFSLME